jgi:hypothetical protein
VKADDSYWTLGVGRGFLFPLHPSFLFALCLSEGASVNDRVLRGFERRFVVRAILGDLGFTISVLVAVAVTVIFAFALDAPLPIVASILILGLFTALAEYFLRSNLESP